jgi:hypothetical protein
MKIELSQYQENEDGSADFHVDMDKESTHSLINFALVTLLVKAAEEGTLYTPDAEEEEEDVNYFYDEDEDIEYYYVEDEDAWYYYDEDEDDWFIVEEEESDDEVWFSLEPEQMDAFFAKELKNCLEKTYTTNLTFLEDIDNNIRVRNACKTLLRYYMIPSEADDYLDKVAATYEC